MGCAAFFFKRGNLSTFVFIYTHTLEDEKTITIFPRVHLSCRVVTSKVTAFCLQFNAVFQFNFETQEHIP